MQVKVTGRHMSVTDAMKSYADEKARKLVKFFDRIQEIRVVLDFEGARPTVECIVDVERADDFVAHETHDDIYAAIDAVSDKLERQLRRHKEMIKGHHKEHHRGRENEPTE